MVAEASREWAPPARKCAPSISLKDATAVYPTGAEGSLDEIESAETAYKLSGAIVDGLERIKKGEKGRGTRSSAE